MAGVEDVYYKSWFGREGEREGECGLRIAGWAKYGLKWGRGGVGGGMRERVKLPNTRT